VVRMTRKLLASRPSSRPNEASGFRVSHTCWWLGVANYVLQEAQARLRKSTSAKTLHFWRLKLAFPHHSPHPNRRMVTFQY